MRELAGRAGEVGEHASSTIAIGCSGGEGFECRGECGEIRRIRGQRGRRLTEVCDHGVQVTPKLRGVSLDMQRDREAMVLMGMSAGRQVLWAMVVVVIATGSEEWDEEQE